MFHRVSQNHESAKPRSFGRSDKNCDAGSVDDELVRDAAASLQQVPHRSPHTVLLSLLIVALTSAHGPVVSQSLLCRQKQVQY